MLIRLAIGTFHFFELFFAALNQKYFSSKILQASPAYVGEETHPCKDNIGVRINTIRKVLRKTYIIKRNLNNIFAL